jgi:hypothetical protein
MDLLIPPPMRADKRRSITRARAANLRRQRLERHACLIHGLGPRALAELLDEICRVTGRRAIVEDIAERFAVIDLEALIVTGGDRFAPMLIRIIGDEQ